MEPLRDFMGPGVCTTQRGAELRTRLALPQDARDEEVARSLFQRICDEDAASVELRVADSATQALLLEVPHTMAADSSFLGRLSIRPAGDRPAVDRLDDTRTLVAIVHGGTLRQRRAALLRLGTQLEHPDDLAPDALSLVFDAVDVSRDLETAYERSLVRVKLGGTSGRNDRADREHWRKLVSRLERDIVLFWSGDRAEEPITNLPSDERAQLLMRTRDLPDTFLHHITALIEGTAGFEGLQKLLLSSLRYSADGRLVPSLLWMIEELEPDVSNEAARILGRIEDPRIVPALQAAYERAVTDMHKAVIAGSLGALGDMRGASYVRGLLRSDDPSILLVALEALETLGAAEDTDAVAAFTKHADSSLVRQSIRTLCRIGDSRALTTLDEIRARSSISSLIAEADEARVAVLARMELRGEDITSANVPRSGEMLSKAAPRESGGVYVRGRWDYWMGLFWFAVGNMRRAVQRFEMATSKQPSWLSPILFGAMAHARAEQNGDALRAFRVAIEQDRQRIERNPVMARTAVRTFLRRSEEVEREGRRDIALGLVEEVLTLDLRGAPSTLRFELERKRDSLRK